MSRNILIDSNSAQPAKNIASVRELLGVRASDNLVNASHVLVVEGQEDVVALKALLAFLSPKLAGALKLNLLVIEPLGGASKLEYKLSMLANALCMSHVVLDNDDEGRTSCDKAVDANLLKLADVTMVNCQGMKQAEMEDCFDPNCYRQAVLEQFGVSLQGAAFRSNEKWSDRVGKCFLHDAKPWGDRVKARVKAVVAQAVAAAPDLALNAHKRHPIDALVRALESKLERAQFGRA